MAQPQVDSSSLMHLRPVNWAPYAFLAPATVILGLFFFWPLAQALHMSFTNATLLGTPQWVGLANYQKLLADPVFWKALLNTFLYLVGVVPPLVLGSLVLAILVNNKLRGITFFRAAYYLPVVVSLVVAAIAWRWLYAEKGVLNSGLEAIGLPGVGWLTDPRVALWAVMAVTVWKGLGYYMVIYLAGLQTIPEEMYEAGRLDGASVWQLHRFITLPMVVPSIALVAIISSISAFKIFTEVFVMTNGGPLNSTATLVFYLYEEAFVNGQFGYACAAGWVLFVVVLLFSILNLRQFEKGAVQA